ncbi:ComEA family DNA-binding protein [Sphingobacterium bovistauri]|uniref:Helix-hairpin-helix domain-containing protein n=1 Tax=Sphingobacterium bovistauri TaxID=2781959 RepID=A0ABS7Z5X2_9SPHI|nr:helix-hairpin-helix domain-containing protein [Sphingobacterium bovistauri]MCA5005578.1 helix-hairpin-helix domain-containing protein [Sphingobacterium bovistauri]
MSLIITICASNCFAQLQETTIEESLLEQISEELGENVDVSDVLERLQYVLRHPYDLNKVTEEELAGLVFLSPQQISNLIAHREESGDFINILELQGIVGMDMKTINLLRSFVKVGEVSSFKDLSWKSIRQDDEHSLLLRYGRTLENQQGYDINDTERSQYLGDKNAYSLRYRWNYQQKLKIGINAEKDAGEPFFKLKQNAGFDFYSGYLEVNDISKVIQKIVIGDYSLQIGQGVILWNGLSFGKGAWIGAVARQGIGLRSYSSMNENNFQRGISARLKFKNIEWTPFVAYNQLSGNVEETDSLKLIRTINISGLHRTPTEQSYRNTIGQLVAGSAIKYNYNRLKLGFTALYTGFRGKKIKSDDIRNQYDFEGSNLMQLGVDYNYNFRNFYFFGETAHNIGSGFATVNGLIASLHTKVSVFANYRNFQRNYHGFYAQTLSEGTGVANEKGLYAGLVYHVTRKFEWVNYVDVFKFPWLRFREDGPSDGVDFLSQATYSWYKRGKFVLRYRYRIKQENLALPQANENILADVVRNQFRVDYEYKLNDTWNIKSRAELSLFDKKKESRSEGYMIFQDVYWKGLKNKLQLNSRVSYFNIKDYDSRIYAYESDVLYGASFPMYYDQGIRSYVNVRWRLSRHIDFWLRYSITSYLDRENIGSGLDLIKGNRRSDIKLQVRWQW